MEKGYSVYEAFAALDEIEDEVDSFPTTKKDSRVIQEGKGFDLRNFDDVDKAAEFREKDKNTQDVQLEVIDPDADSLENMKSPEEYIGQMLLQCNTCKATTFVPFDDLEKSETDDEIYNMEMECPHCHGKGAGYTLIGQVGKSEEPKVDNDEKSDDEASFENDLEDETEQEGTDVINNDDTEDKEGDSDTFQWEDGGEQPIDDTDTSEDDDKDTEEDKEDKEESDGVKADDTEEEESEEEKKKKKAKKEALEEAKNEAKEQLGRSYKYFSADEVKNEMHDLIPEMTYNKIVDSGLVDDFGDIVIPKGTKVEKLKEDEDYTYYKFIDYDIVLPVDKLLTNQPVIEKVGEEIKEEVTNEDVDLTEWTGSVDAFIHHFITENDKLSVNFYTEDGSKIASFDGDDEDAKEIPFTILSASVVKFSFTASQIDLNLTDSEQEYTVEKLFDMYNIDEDSANITFSIYEDEEYKEDLQGVEELINRYGKKNIQLPFSVNGLNLFIEGENIEPESDDNLGEVNLEEELINTIINQNRLLVSHKDRPNTRENFIAESIRLKEDLDIVYRNFVTKLPEGIQIRFKETTGYKDRLDEVLAEYGYNRNNIQPYTVSDDSMGTPEVTKKVVEENFKPGEGLYESVKTRAELENVLTGLQEANIGYRVRKSLKEGYRFDIITTGSTPLKEANLLNKIKNVDSKFNPEKVEEEPTKFDEDKFDEAVNKFLFESYANTDTVLNYRSVRGTINELHEIVVEGVIEGFDKEQPIKFTLTPNKTLDESLNKEVISSYTVSNNLSEEVFTY